MSYAASANGSDAGPRLASHPLNGREADPRLTCWLNAADGPDADRALAGLLEEVAMPVIEGVIGRKFGSESRRQDAEDVVSEARWRLIRRLQYLRETWSGSDGLLALDLPAYVATVSYTAWANHLRRRHPARAMLLNRLRYLLENRAGPRGFALWPGPGGAKLAGFQAWRDEGRTAQPSPRERWLLTDANAAAADAFGGADKIPADLAALTAGLLVWLGGPLELRDLTRALTELLRVGAPVELSGESAGEAAADPPDSRPSPHESLRWKEYLGWLWRQVLALPLRQRIAFLCHSSLLREMELLGLTSIRVAAVALEISPERMAGIWSRLPLNDLEITALFDGSNRQQVINLRKAARATLGRAWQESQAS